jgi:hypothetical protein
MKAINVCNLRHINVYSLPRSGTNLFAAINHVHPEIFSINHVHPEIFSINVGGGRYPLAFSWRDLLKQSIIVNGEIEKDRDQVRYILRDELKFGFVGRRVTHFSQFLFKLISFFRSNDAIVILLRNPYAIASSMHRYFTKKNHKRWNMESDLNIKRFANDYFNLIYGGWRVKKNSLFVSIEQFVSDKNIADKYYKYLDTYPIEYMGFQYLNCQCGQKFDVYKNAVYCNVCGPICGEGGLNLSQRLDINRLRDMSFLSTASKVILRKNLLEKFGEDVDKIFSMDGTIDVTLLNNLQTSINI